MSDAMKLPPQNIEAEQSVLGSILLDKDALLKIADFCVRKIFTERIMEKFMEQS